MVEKPSRETEAIGTMKLASIRLIKSMHWMVGYSIGSIGRIGARNGRRLQRRRCVTQQASMVLA